MTPQEESTPTSTIARRCNVQVRKARLDGITRTTLTRDQLAAMLNEHEWPIGSEPGASFNIAAAWRRHESLLSRATRDDRLREGHLLELVAAAAGHSSWNHFSGRLKKPHRDYERRRIAAVDQPLVDRFSQYSLHRADVDPLLRPGRRRLEGRPARNPKRFGHLLAEKVASKNYAQLVSGTTLERWGQAAGAMIAMRVLENLVDEAHEEVVVSESICDVMTAAGFCGYVKASMTKPDGSIEPRSAPESVLQMDGIIGAIELAERGRVATIFETMSPRTTAELCGLTSLFAQLQTAHQEHCAMLKVRQVRRPHLLTSSVGVNWSSAR